MVFKGVCSYRVLYAFLVSFMSCLPSTDSFELKFLNDSPSVTVENGVESHLDFFLRDFASLNKLIRIIVQYQRSGGNYDNKCQMKHSKTSGCTVLFGPCECVGEQSGSFRYRLKMNFTEQDSGSLHFSIVDHNSFFVNVNVVSAVHATQYLTRPTTHQYKAMPVSTSAPLTTTIRPTTIPFSTTTPTTTSTMVDLATKAATRHLELDTPDPLKTEADNHNGGTEDEPESEEALQSNGTEFEMHFCCAVLTCLVSGMDPTVEESLTFHIEGNKTSFTFPLGVTSQIKFYVRNEDDFRVYVQHKAAEKDNYNTMCIVYQTASKVCSTNNNICRCPEDTNNAFSLNKIFLQSDAGLWMFRPWQHNNISKTVNVSISGQSQLTTTDVTSIAIVAVLSFITLVAIALTSVVNRHPGIITRLRRPPAIGEKTAKLWGHVDVR
ncbi:hypothetical protein C0Q70_12470 [Pomacea canaliculata]|uniref:Uncharacterized protein n=1 Tax=Pomacea canaliculata TaxID=400727 RepID=A0A2T7P1M6_POMCA|nr:hypothetical protein C0Q70_12470 [Pomacea canaliculata]